MSPVIRLYSDFNRIDVIEGLVNAMHSGRSLYLGI